MDFCNKSQFIDMVLGRDELAISLGLIAGPLLIPVLITLFIEFVSNSLSVAIRSSSM